MRLIDADEMALNESEAYMSAQTKLDNPITLGLNSVVHRKIQQLIADTPTVDAVEVVRCRNCAVPHNQYTGCPKLNGLVTTPDFYCPFGERKDCGWNG